VLCTLPFEPRWYSERGVPDTNYVGHPYFDELAERKLDAAVVAKQRNTPGRMVAILPGSRTQELKRNLPMMLRAAAKLLKSQPNARFTVACLHERHRELAAQIIAAECAADLPIELHAGHTPELIRVAEVAWAVSGSVGLELMCEALPTVVVYKLNRLDLLIARPFIKAKYISLVNLLADAEVMPEYLTTKDVSDEMAAHASKWLGDARERANASNTIADLRSRVAVPGATERAAEVIADLLEPPSTLLQGPHLNRVAPPQAAMADD
jgi:lipid-A-disaccharide synthase